MQVYLGGKDITLAIPLVDEFGETLDVESIQYRVIDQDEAEIVAKVALASFASGDPEAAVTITADQNAVPDKRALRVVELYITSSTGAVTLLTSEYVLELSSVLEVGSNSFQAYASALLVAFELPNLPGWNGADRKDRINALMAAYRSCAKLSLRYVTEEVDVLSRVIQPAEWNSSNITKMSGEQLLSLPDDYLAALRRAQVIEADFLLGGDEAGDIRRSGVMSATVGESSQFFRTAKPLEAVLCKRAMRELARYLCTTYRVGRGS